MKGSSPEGQKNMGSWIQCLCGSSIHTNLFAGASVFRLIKDSDYDALDCSVDRDKLENLFFTLGIPVYLCKSCGRLAVEWDHETGPWFYTPEGQDDRQYLMGCDADDAQRLKELEATAEAEYEEMYDSPSPTAAYSRAKEVYNDAIAFARTLGWLDEVARLEKRLQHLKDVFRTQFADF
jgi:hypothetical protein